MLVRCRAFANGLVDFGGSVADLIRFRGSDLCLAAEAIRHANRAGAVDLARFDIARAVDFYSAIPEFDSPKILMLTSGSDG